jgi:hypothetical protein
MHFLLQLFGFAPCNWSHYIDAILLGGEEWMLGMSSIVLLRDVGQVEFCLVLFGDSVNLGTR